MRKRERERAPGFTGVGVCAHIGVAGEIRAAGSAAVFGMGGKDK